MGNFKPGTTNFTLIRGNTVQLLHFEKIPLLPASALPPEYAGYGSDLCLVPTISVICVLGVVKIVKCIISFTDHSDHFTWTML